MENKACDILGLVNIRCRYCDKHLDCVEEKKLYYGWTVWKKYSYSICIICHDNFDNSILSSDCKNCVCINTIKNGKLKYIKLYK